MKDLNFLSNFLADAAHLDDNGMCGNFVHYAFIIAFVGGASIGRLG